MNEVIVTGARGFLGSHVVLALQNRGDDVVLYERHDNWESVDQFFRSPRAVIHLGAVTSTTETDASLIIESNQLLSSRIWKYCTANRVPLIYASSASVYGSLGRVPMSDGCHDDVFPDMNVPLSLYADSKRWFDAYALRQVDSPPHWYGVRLFNVYGDGEDHKGAQASVVSKWLRAGMAGGCIELFDGSAEYSRDFVFVDDVVNVILWALDNKPPSGIYNVGTGRAETFLSVVAAVDMALESAGYALPQTGTVPIPEDIAAHYQRWTEADIGKLRKAGYDLSFRYIFAGTHIVAQRMVGMG